MNIFLVFVSALAVLPVGGATQLNSDAPATWAKAQEELNAWFAPLEWPAVKDGQFVEVTYTYPGNKAWHFSDAGFMDPNGDKDIYYTPDLIRQRLRTKNYTQEIVPSSAPADFKSWVAATLQKKDDGFVNLASGSVFRDQSAYWFMVSRACAFRGLQPLAEACLARSKKEAEVRSAEEFKSRVEMAVSGQMFLNIKSEMADPHYPRPFLIKELARFIATDPGDRDLEQAQKYKAAYEEMVKGDENHPIASMAQLSQQDRIKELVFELRDQEGEQLSNPGGVQFETDPRGANSPAMLLIKEGPAAAPELINNLSSEGLTRAAETGHGNDLHPVTIGAACHDLLYAIACRSFYPQGQVQDYEAAFKAGALKWLSEVNAKGEIATLREDVASPESNSWALKRLIVLDPKLGAKDALAALGKNLGITYWYEYFRAAKAADPEATRAFALHWAKEALEPWDRAWLAATLLTTDRELALSALLKEWHNLTPPLATNKNAGSLAQLLLATGSQEAVAEVTAKIDSLSLEDRKSIVEGFELFSSDGPIEFPIDTWNSVPPIKRNEPGFAKYMHACETLLAGQLDRKDLVIAPGEFSSHSNGEVSYSEVGDATLGDKAAENLAKLMPKRYSYKYLASPYERKMQRLRVINTWRVSNGQQALPLPPKPIVAPMVTAIFQKQWKQLLSSKSKPERAAALSAIRQDGLPALHPLLAAMKTLNPVLEDVAALAREISMTVITVQIDPAIRDAAFVTRARKLKDHAFTPETFPELFTAAHSFPKHSELLMTAIREEDGMGVSVTFALAKPVNPDVGFDRYVQVETDGPLNSSAGGFDEGYESDIEDAFKEDPLKVLYIGVAVSVNRE